MIYKVYKDPLYIQCEGVVQEPESQVAEAAKRGEGPGAEVKGVRDFKWRDFKWQDFLWRDFKWRDFGGNRTKFGQISGNFEEKLVTNEEE